jgi:hypothetical protein
MCRVVHESRELMGDRTLVALIRYAAEKTRQFEVFRASGRSFILALTLYAGS